MHWVLKIYEISAINGSGTGELLDEVVKEFEHTTMEEVPDLPKLLSSEDPMLANHP
jgi:predicted GTPase